MNAGESRKLERNCQHALLYLGEVAPQTCVLAAMHHHDWLGDRTIYLRRDE